MFVRHWKAVRTTPGKAVDLVDGRPLASPVLLTTFRGDQGHRVGGQPMFAARAVVCTHHRPPPAAHANSGNAARSRCHVEFVDCTHRRRTWKCPPGLKHHTESSCLGLRVARSGGQGAELAPLTAASTACAVLQCFHCLCCDAECGSWCDCRVRLRTRFRATCPSRVGRVRYCAPPIWPPRRAVRERRRARGERRRTERCGALTPAGGYLIVGSSMPCAPRPPTGVRHERHEGP